MIFHAAIMGCCGIHGLSRIPSNLDIFKAGVKNIIRHDPYYSARRSYYGGYNLHCIKGAGIQINLAHYQTGALKFTHRNSSSGNTDHVLFMDRAKWNRMVGKWMKEDSNG